MAKGSGLAAPWRRCLSRISRQVGILVGAQDLGVERLAVVEQAAHFDGLVDDVPVGEHFALGGDDHAAAGDFARDFLAAGVVLRARP